MDLTDYICKDVIINIFSFYVSHWEDSYKVFCSIIPELRVNENKFYKRICFNYYQFNPDTIIYGYDTYVDNILVISERYYENGTPYLEDEFTQIYNQKSHIWYVNKAPAEINERLWNYGKKSIKWYENGRIESIQNFLHLGNNIWSFESFFDNGNMKEEIYYDINGAYHGIIKFYYSNGQIKERIKYRRGIKHGKNEVWRSDGTKSIVIYWEDGKNLRQHIFP